MGRLSFLSRLSWSWPRRWKISSTVPSVLDVPERIRRRQAVLVGSDTHPKWLAFDCPCTERHRVVINLDRHNYPSWTVLTAAPLTLTPSVDETRRMRRCHYVIRRGRVRWV
jgi:hypothetical protein